MARRYQKMQAMLPEIKQMLEEGKIQREVTEILGLEGDRPVHALLKREKRKDMQEICKSRGRNPAKTLEEYKRENARLRMENELPRGFLRSAERK